MNELDRSTTKNEGQMRTNN